MAVEYDDDFVVLMEVPRCSAGWDEADEQGCSAAALFGPEDDLKRSAAGGAALVQGCACSNAGDGAEGSMRVAVGAYFCNQ